MTKLLILDLNGLLVSKQPQKLFDCRYQVQKCGSYYVYLRPNVHEFIDQIMDLYDVGIFSSTTYKNAQPIVELLFKDKHKQLKFKWFRDRTEFDPDSQDHATVKELDRIWRNSAVNWHRKYSNKNTLLCDDDHTKLRFNDKKNYLVVPKFDPTSKFDLVLDDLLEQITDKFTDMAD